MSESSHASEASPRADGRLHEAYLLVLSHLRSRGHLEAAIVSELRQQLRRGSITTKLHNTLGVQAFAELVDREHDQVQLCNRIAVAITVCESEATKIYGNI